MGESMRTIYELDNTEFIAWVRNEAGYYRRKRLIVLLLECANRIEKLIRKDK